MHPLLLALAAAILFGASTPASKALLLTLTPFQLAGLLYLGAGVGVAPLVIRQRARRPRGPMSVSTRARLSGATVLGGMIAPVLLLFALRTAAAGSVSLLLNIEMVMTAILGVAFFHEHLGRMGWFGVLATVGAGALLSFGGGPPGVIAGVLAAGACLCWGLDNNLTALIDGVSPAETTLWKGVVAGATNLVLGLVLAPLHAPVATVACALLLGMLSYGASLVLYIGAAQQIGAARSQAAFATAPFVGALLSFVLLKDPIGWEVVVAGLIFGIGVALSFLDRHAHEHTHEALTHIHAHAHDDGHHDHEHQGLDPRQSHTHEHSHVPVTHSHRHLPDLHHRHAHRSG